MSARLRLWWQDRCAGSTDWLITGTVVMLAVAYAGETGELEGWIGIIIGMSCWYILKAIFMSETGGVAGECSQAFKEAFKQRQLRTT